MWSPIEPDFVKYFSEHYQYGNNIIRHFIITMACVELHTYVLCMHVDTYVPLQQISGQQAIVTLNMVIQIPTCI